MRTSPHFKEIQQTEKTVSQETQIEINVLASLSHISEVEWDRCACPEAKEGRPVDPFTTYRFLKALEDSNSIGPGTGWTPHYLQANLDDKTIGVAPLYGKTHSQGEYIFDHNFAQAYENSGGSYYPKLQLAVPHTPATGRRLLVDKDHAKIAQSALVKGAVQLAAENKLSSLHITFCTEAEAEAGALMGLQPRKSQQFHWINDGYDSFDDFLANLSSRKRKNIRKERAQAQDFGGQIEVLTGDDIQPHHWDAFWTFYQDTGTRKWGTPYLTRQFFNEAQIHLRDDILLVLAKIEGSYVAGALNFIGRDALYGRYWGCIQDFPCLHFELCYYQAIEFAITEGLLRVEAGAQGAHKLARGYMPVVTHSLHWFGDPGFSDAVIRYLQAEREAVDEEINVLTGYGPFKKIEIEEQQ